MINDLVFLNILNYVNFGWFLIFSL